ncbi:MAG: hypothetical protein GWM92_10365, partial [Gemmatimonadetes bacterium]|nr:hypothetical protein [Gemmatimonadota bacterium]NIR79648.1 hypothetical protein [Gemmatimonadota bacterium]NIT87736.1 hypothetical protein [Gemmatimonadota bacterium]NIU32157.1 hypothetical protein [Gemmatimonadota bacterium]NIU36240.1 hypothetical protein [Gemmatimonadota bacterium]
PLFRLTVGEGLLDPEGLHLTGSGSLALSGGTSVGVSFSDLTLGLPDFGIAAGSAGFTSAFGLRVGLGDGDLSWEAVDAAAALEPGDGFRMTLPGGVGLGSEGLRIDGTSTAALEFGGRSFLDLEVDFRDAFALGFDPVGVRSGRADFNTDEGLVGWVDPGGFHPGDLFAVVDLPRRIGLPTEDVAYLVVADETRELVETESVPDGMALRTRAGEAVELVIPALASAGGAAPRIGVEFDVVVNPGDFDFVSGSVRAVAGEGEPPLLSLGDLGIPLDLSEIAYENPGDGYGLRVGADLRLPEALGGLDVAFTDVRVDDSGLSGTAEVGSYAESYDPGAEAAGSTTLGADVDLELLGVRAVFAGRDADIDLAAAVETPLFAPEGGAPEPLFFTAGLGPAGDLDATVEIPGVLPVWLAEFDPMPVAGSPGVALSVSGTDFDLTLNGVLSAPAINDEFAITIAGLSLGTGGIEIPEISLSAADAQEFELFGSAFRLFDVGGTPALSFAYEGGVLSAVMSGELEFLEETTSFRGLSVGSDGSISIETLNLLTREVSVVPEVLTLDTLKIEARALVAGFEVRLPEPLDAGGPQRGRFSVDADGSVEGGARIALIDEEPGLGGDRTAVELGDLATVHPHYVALNLSVGGSSSGRLEVASDVYVQNTEDNVIHIGEKDGGRVDPGLVIDFGGGTSWGP